MPEVSIIVPAYNAEKTIGRCVESILHQTYPDFELLLMDDGSTDGTPDIIDRYAAQDPRVRAIHKENSGVSDTRNQGLFLSKGTYIQFLDADDWIVPDATRLFVRAMEENNGCDMVIADFYRVIDKRMSQKGDIDEERLITREEYAEYMMHNPADYYYGVLWNKFFRRSMIVQYDLKMDINLSWAEDFIFNMEYILHTDRIYVLKVPVYYYVKTEGSLVTQNSLSIAKTVQMKLNVIEYYSHFYKNIYPEESYYRRSPAIYSFFLEFAKDGSVNPVSPDRRIGQSRLNVHFSPEMRTSPLVANFYEERLLDTCVSRIMNGNDLEENDARLLIYLQLSGGSATTVEIRNFTGLSARAVSSSVQKLTHRGIVERVKRPRVRRSRKSEEKAAPDLSEETPSSDTAEAGEEKKKSERLPVLLTFGKDAAAIREAISRAFRDMEELQMRDFTDTEKETYLRLQQKMTDNMCRALIEPAVSEPRE